MASRVYVCEAKLSSAISRWPRSPSEDPAAQKLIAELGLKGRVFTLDAELLVKKLSRSPAQRATISSWKRKGNQPKLLRQAKALARESPALSTHRQFNHARQRMEWREVRVFAAAALPAEWDGLIHTVIEVRRTRDVFYAQSGEWRKTEQAA